jgi:hypothetical protein
MILELIAMIVLGFLSAALTAYNKNYYVRVFDDILGREEEGKVTERLGRSFVYGFLFPIYFILVVWLLIALIAFLIAAGIIAAIIFVLVWITEKIIPNIWLGSVVEAIFDKIGIRCVEAEPAGAPAPGTGPRLDSAPSPAPPSAPARPREEESAEDPENPFPGGNINRSRRHSID